MRRSSLLLGLTLASVASCPWAASGPVTQTAQATASVSNACVIQSLTGLAFGSYNPTSGTPAVAAGSIQMVCTKAAPYQVGLNTGLRGNNTMTGPGGSLGYALYQDSALSKPFGSGQPLALGPLVNGVTVFCFQGITGNLQTAQAAGPYAAYGNGSYAYGYAGQTVIGSFGNQYAACSSAFGSANSYGFYYTSGAGQGSSSLSVKTSGDMPTSGNVFFAATGVGSVKGTATSTKTSITIPVYGRLAATQDVTPGNYSDTITATVSF